MNSAVFVTLPLSLSRLAELGVIFSSWKIDIINTFIQTTLFISIRILMVVNGHEMSICVHFRLTCFYGDNENIFSAQTHTFTFFQQLESKCFNRIAAKLINYWKFSLTFHYTCEHTHTHTRTVTVSNGSVCYAIIVIVVAAAGWVFFEM